MSEKWTARTYIVYTGDGGFSLHDLPKGEERAAFIVKAVNNHDALVKALEDLLGSSQAVHQWLTNWDVPFADDNEWDGDKKLFAEARAEAARVLGAVGAPKQP